MLNICIQVCVYKWRSKASCIMLLACMSGDAGVIDVYNPNAGFYMGSRESKLSFSYLCSKHFICQAIPPALKACHFEVHFLAAEDRQ